MMPLSYKTTTASWCSCAHHWSQGAEALCMVHGRQEWWTYISNTQIQQLNSLSYSTYPSWIKPQFCCKTLQYASHIPYIWLQICVKDREYFQFSWYFNHTWVCPIPKGPFIKMFIKVWMSSPTMNDFTWDTRGGGGSLNVGSSYQSIIQIAHRKYLSFIIHSLGMY